MKLHAVAACAALALAAGACGSVGEESSSSAPEAGDDPQVATLLRSALRTLSKA